MFDPTLLVDHFPYAGIFALLILGGIGLPFPEDATLILSGVLVAHGIVRILPALLIVYAGLLLSDFFLYGMGRKYGRRVIEHKRFQKMISSERLQKLEAKFEKNDFWVILLGRHILGLRAQIFLAAGVMRMPLMKFLLADTVAALLTIAFMGGIGYAGGNSMQILKKDLSRIEHIVIVTLAISFTCWIVIKYFKGNKSFLKAKKGGPVEL